MYESFETERLFLRPTDLSDAEYQYALMNTPKWIQYIGDRNIRSVEDAGAYITNNIQSQFARLGYGNYTMVRKSDQERVGNCGLYDREGVDGMDLGFALLPEFEGNGYAFEGARCIRDAAFREFDLPIINAITTRENIASQRLLSKLGFDFKQELLLPGDDEAVLLYKMERGAM